ncbi:hypothetical protein [Pseudomonas sp. YJ42]|uniref:hypothetical protein n=1 Tax=Pseudomonas sp. YJ42 TaxID=3392115 RepID=UPI0039A3E0D1
MRGRNLTQDGYNLGLRYQCVEFVKRYYFERHGHRMPDSYGHAKDFFDPQVGDGALNARRGLLQFTYRAAASGRPAGISRMTGCRVGSGCLQRMSKSQRSINPSG